VVIGQLTSQEKFTEVLPYLETALEQNSDNYDLQTLKLRVLNRLERQAEVGAQLKLMVGVFPGNDDLKVALIRWFLVQQDQEGALAFLRDEAGALDAEPAGHIQVVQFLNSTQGSEAGLAELENLITANKGSANEAIYAAFRATMVFEAGQQQAAISELQNLLETVDGAEHTNDIKALLARMLDHTGKRAEATKLVDEVLAADSSNVDALKLQAGWAIAEDRINDAILSLRSALDQAPRDAAVMTMLASAHDRDGNKDLTGEYLSKAVEFSGAGSAESLRYARFLMGQGRTQGAETILADSYRAFPGNLAVLRTLGDVFLQTKQWARAGEIAKLLDQADTAETRQVAERIRAAILLMQNRIEEGLQLLETSAANDQDNMNPTLVVVLTQIRAGKTDEAREFLNTALEKFPDSESLRLLDASLYAVMGKPEQAEPAYRELIKDRPTAEAPARLLYGFLRGEGRLEDATAVLQEALTHQPDSATLLRFRAGELEQAGEIDATIDIYERLYEADSANVILANNLASMLATYRQDDASLERARLVARRLRGTTFAPFQDTIGWIQYRLNNLEDALFYLEPAASDLPNDPVVQFHLGMVYTGLQRPDAAIKQFERALELGEDRKLPQLGEARAQLAALRNAE
ncbi:tetratricopeptide repeat protein, partial [Sulfitobacter pontiacus]|uniref:tetratricopeptide repeat protein n=1 Tax=Sulfitobacter pontiacus TaxID=60137 RepID=UPI0032986316